MLLIDVKVRLIFDPETVTMEASVTAFTAMEEAMTLDPKEPALMFAAVKLVSAAPLTAGKAADPSSCTSLFAMLKVLPCLVTLEESMAELATLPVIFDPETPTIEES